MARTDVPSAMQRTGEPAISPRCQLVATAIARAVRRAELAASRRRVVAATDAACRRIERNLHDGPQQRLVALGFAVRAAETHVPSDLSELRSELSQISTGIGDAITELQEIARGIHPANLSRGGLAPALRMLARRSPIPVDLEIAIENRLPELVEVAMYYVASEALTNAAKHSHASCVAISLEPHVNCVVLAIRDDGGGGVDLAKGSGLVGLTNRVEALGGSINIRSSAGSGTLLRTEIPLDADCAGH